MSAGDIPTPDAAVTIKLGSLAVHVQEATGPTGSPEDMRAAAALAGDPDVVAWLDAFDPALLPLKR